MQGQNEIVYELAKRLLHEHFADEFKVPAAYTEKALAWPAVKSEDVKALQASPIFAQSLQRNGRTRIHARTEYASKHENSNVKTTVQIKRKMVDCCI